MHALFIGRFQPFHNGHLHVIQDQITNFSKLIIGIGSSQYQHTQQNPFSYEERKTMITTVLDYEQITNYTILAIPDIHDPPRWVDHVLTITRDFTDVFTNNSHTAELFKEQGFSTHMLGLYEKQKYSGEEIRRRMRHEEPWTDLVHPLVAAYLREINAEDRLKN